MMLWAATEVYHKDAIFYSGSESTGLLIEYRRKLKTAKDLGTSYVLNTETA